MVQGDFIESGSDERKKLGGLTGESTVVVGQTEFAIPIGYGSANLTMRFGAFTYDLVVWGLSQGLPRYEQLLCGNSPMGYWTATVICRLVLPQRVISEKMQLVRSDLGRFGRIG